MFPVSIEILFFRVNDLSFLPVGYQYLSIAADLFFSFIYQDVERDQVFVPFSAFVLLLPQILLAIDHEQESHSPSISKEVCSYQRNYQGVQLMNN